MKKYLICFITLFFYLLAPLITLGKVESKMNEEEFVNIATAIYSNKKLQKYLFQYEYKGRRALFVLNDSEFIKNPDRAFKKDFNGNDIFYWFEKHIFFYNIEFWLVFESIKICENNTAIVKIKTVNSVNSTVRRKTVNGIIELKKTNGVWIMKNNRKIKWHETESK